MSTYYTKVISSVSRSKASGAIFVGPRLCPRVKDVRVKRGKHGWLDTTVTITSKDGQEYTVVQYDRGYFELKGPRFEHGIEVIGWADAVRMIDNL